MKKGLIIAIVVIILILIISITSFVILKKDSGGGSGLDFGNMDYSKGTVDLEFDGGSSLEKVETNPFRYGEDNG